MSTEKPAILFHLSEENKRKVKILADLENRSVSNYLEQLIIKAVKEYETNNNVTL